MNATCFYSAFEDRYRGARELIKSRLCVYRPFVEPLLDVYRYSRAVDLGCGRGEWLELMGEWGFDASGVDLDDGMLSECRERRLKVQSGDAIEFLRSLPDASQVIVSGFHFAEHIPFAALQTLVVEGLRVLQPGGLLILETPNPENVVVGTSSFYLDPTHQRPIPPQLMAFLPEHYGFERVKILRLQEADELAVQENVTLLDVFVGVSPDYAVIAQKLAGPVILETFSAVFEKSHGLELSDLTCRYDAVLDRRLAALNQRISNAESQAGGMSDALARIADLQDRLVDAVMQVEQNAAQAQAAESRAEEQEQRAIAAESRAEEQEQRAIAAESRAEEQEQRAIAAEIRTQDLEQKNHELGGNCHHWQQRARALEAERNALRQSWSWRITAPVRWAGGIAIGGATPLKRGVSTVVRISIAALHRPVAILMRTVLRRPHLSYRINQRLMCYPALHQRPPRRSPKEWRHT